MTENDPQDHSAPARPEGVRGSSGSARWIVAVLLAVVVVVAAAAVVWELTSLRSRADADTARQTTRSAATAAAERFTVQFNTYDPSSLPGYEKRVKAMLSPKFGEDFEKSIDQLRTTITSGKVDSRGRVLASAIANQDADSAQVLVVADADASTVYDKSVARHFRWQVDLVKIDGRWLVDKYEPVQ